MDLTLMVKRYIIHTMMYLTVKNPTKWLLSTVVIATALTVTDRHASLSSALRDGVGLMIKAVDSRQLLCLTENIFREARGEPLLGQAAVARVVVNRINHGFGKTPCDVIYQKHPVSDAYTGKKKILCQFSWVCEERKPLNDRDPGYLRSREIAYRVLAYDDYKEVVSESTLFFHANSVNPKWNYNKVITIGNHHFYSKK